MKKAILTLTLLFQTSLLIAHPEVVWLSSNEIMPTNEGIFVERDGQLLRVVSFEETSGGLIAVVRAGIGDLCIRCREGIVICTECWGCSNSYCGRRCRCDD